MYCPRCGQQQLPDEVRFCSRCGLQLASVSQFLRTDSMAFIQPKERLPLIKREELRKGAKVAFLSFFSFVPAFILAIIVDHPFPLVVPLLGFVVGLAQMLYYFLFGESILPTKKTSEFNEYQHQFNYQPAPALPLKARTFNTAEFVHPQSITEPTANLYKNK